MRGRRAAMLGLAIAAAGGLVGSLARALPAPAPTARARVLRLDVKQAITGGTTEYLEAGLKRAREEGFDLLLVVLDTPGGHLDATRDIVQHMLASEREWSASTSARPAWPTPSVWHARPD